MSFRHSARTRQHRNHIMWGVIILNGLHPVLKYFVTVLSGNHPKRADIAFRSRPFNHCPGESAKHIATGREHDEALRQQVTHLRQRAGSGAENLAHSSTLSLPGSGRTIGIARLQKFKL